MDFNRLENVAKRITVPKGRSAISTDKAYIYIKEVDGNEKLIGVLTHNRIKTFVPVNSKKAINILINIASNNKGLSCHSSAPMIVTLP